MAKIRRSFGSGIGCYLTIIVLAASLSDFVPPARGDGAESCQEKARLIYYLLKFVSFPDTRFDDEHAPLRVCVLGDQTLAGALSATTSGRTVGGRSVKVIGAATYEAFFGCHAAVIGKQCTPLAAEVFADAHCRQVLTIALQDVLHAKSLITTQTLQDQNRLRIRVDEAHRAGFRISSELLTLAENDHLSIGPKAFARCTSNSIAASRWPSTRAR